MRDTDLALAQRLAEVAGEAIRPLFRSGVAIEDKGDASPVTEADRAAEAAMRRLIEAECPRDGIIGEEYGEKDSASGRQWVLDPIDGTTSFIAGRPIFGTLIALLEDGWPVLGIIDQPISRERWVGAVGQLTMFNGKPARSRTCAELKNAVLATTSPNMFAHHDADRFMALAAQVARRRLVWGGDCYNYGLVASGHIDIVIETDLKLHDFAALVPIVEGAGGTMCDWAGDPLNRDSKGDVIALGDPARLEDVLEVLA
jgi:inositol-phosphate phosphatase / L-galactose 1-phosphate phosphatase / histidinol-phosphatase